MSTPLADEKLAYWFLYVLGKIKEALDLKATGEEAVLYNVFVDPPPQDILVPHPGKEQEILFKLISLGVIEEVNERSDFRVGGNELGDPGSGGITLYLKVDRPAFEEIYNNYKNIVRRLEGAGASGNILTICSDGCVKYVSSEGKVFSGMLNINSNPFRLLMFLAQTPRKSFGFDELATTLKEPKSGGEESTAERRVRDTVQAVRKALKYKKGDLIQCDYGFTLNCDTVEKRR